MVKHIILWQLKDELSDAEKATVKACIKEGLEGLVGKVPGLLEVHVNINGLPTSNADVMLDTTLESFEALKGYAVHPAHVAVADGKVAIAQNMYFAGNTVYLDHGQGVVSSYAHMSRLDVKPGEMVKAGQQIGLVGATGRVTGPHLHLGVNILGVAVDPLSLVPKQ